MYVSWANQVLYSFFDNLKIHEITLIYLSFKRNNIKFNCYRLTIPFYSPRIDTVKQLVEGKYVWTLQFYDRFRNNTLLKETLFDLKVCWFTILLIMSGFSSSLQNNCV